MSEDLAPADVDIEQVKDQAADPNIAIGRTGQGLYTVTTNGITIHYEVLVPPNGIGGMVKTHDQVPLRNPSDLAPALQVCATDPQEAFVISLNNAHDYLAR